MGHLAPEQDALRVVLSEIALKSPIRWMPVPRVPRVPTGDRGVQSRRRVTGNSRQEPGGRLEFRRNNFRPSAEGFRSAAMMCSMQSSTCRCTWNFHRNSWCQIRACPDGSVAEARHDEVQRAASVSHAASMAGSTTWRDGFDRHQSAMSRAPAEIGVVTVHPGTRVLIRVLLKITKCDRSPSSHEPRSGRSRAMRSLATCASIGSTPIAVPRGVRERNRGSGSATTSSYRPHARRSGALRRLLVRGCGREEHVLSRPRESTASPVMSSHRR